MSKISEEFHNFRAREYIGVREICDLFDKIVAAEANISALHNTY